MSPETANVVREWMASCAYAVYLLAAGTILALWCGSEVRDCRTRRRWKSDLSAAHGRITNDRSRHFPKVARDLILEECDESDRLRLANDLLLGRQANLRRTRFVLIVVAMAFGVVAFVVTIRPLPLNDAGQLILPFAAAAAAGIVGEVAVLSLTPKILPLLQGSMTTAAEAVANMLELSESPPPSRFIRLSGRARVRRQVESAFVNAGIPAEDIRGAGLDYDSTEEWEKVEEAAVVRLARGYSGDYVGDAVEPPSRPPLSAAKMAAIVTGVAAVVVSMTQALEALSRLVA